MNSFHYFAIGVNSKGMLFTNLMVFWCFQGVEKGCIGNELVKTFQLKFSHEIGSTTLKTKIWYLQFPKCFKILARKILVNIYLFKVNNGNIRTMCEIRSNVTTIKTQKNALTSLALFWRFCCYLWTDFTPCSDVSIADVSTMYDLTCITADISSFWW